MITLKPCDYLTISLKPDLDNNIELGEMLNIFLDTFYLSDLMPFMVFKTVTCHYEQILRYEDIQVKIPYQENYKIQGICLEFSGHGIDYYVEFLKSKSTTLRSVCRRFLALATKGFKTNCSRFDFAFDEVISSDGDFKNLDLDTIQSFIEQRRFVSCFRRGAPDRHSSSCGSILQDLENFENSSISDIVNNSDDTLTADFLQSINLSSGRIGKTIYLGSKNSHSFIRFYDKFAEREKAGEDLPEDLSSWIRAEMVCRQNNAMSVFVEFCKSTEKEFVFLCAGHFFDKIRFINLDRSRRYNCSIVDWWKNFLNGAERAKFYHFKPKFNKFIRFVDYLKRQTSACIVSVISSNPLEFRSILRYGMEHFSSSKTAQAISSDFDAFQRLSSDEQAVEVSGSLRSLTGLEYLRSFCDLSDDDFHHFLYQIMKEAAA